MTKTQKNYHAQTKKYVWQSINQQKVVWDPKSQVKEDGSIWTIVLENIAHKESANQHVIPKA